MSSTNGNDSGGVLRGVGADTTKNTGIRAAINQSQNRKDYTNKVFDQDNGYLRQSLKSLEEVYNYYEKIVADTNKISKAEEKLAKKRKAEIELLMQRQQKMYNDKEASEKDIVDTIKAQHKLRLEQLENEYKKEQENRDKARKKEKAAHERRMKEISAEIQYAKEEYEEFEVVAERIKKSTKDIGQGLKETGDSLTNTFGEMTKILDLHNIAQNKFLDKANEKYNMMNQINLQLGFDTKQSGQAYNSLIKQFGDFNNNIDGLFAAEDFKEYMNRSNSYGLNSQELLEQNLKSNMMAEKYLGLESSTAESLYKYMRMTNTNDAIAKYNKTMIALTKQGISVNTNMYNKMLQEDVEVSDVLAAAGLSGDALTAFNDERKVLNAQISAKYSPEYAQMLDSTVNDMIKNLGSEAGLQEIATMGVNPYELQSALNSGNANKLYDLVVSAISNGANSWNGDLIGNSIYQKYRGYSAGQVNMAKEIGTNGIDNLGPASKEILDEIKNTSDAEAEQWVKDNEAISELTRISNKIETTINSVLGGNKFLTYETLGIAAFGLYTTGNVLKGIGNMMSGNGPLGKLFEKFTGKSSVLGKGADATQALSNGKSTAGAGLGKLAAGLAVVGLTAAATKAISDAVVNRSNETFQRNYQSNLDSQSNTMYEGNTSVASATSAEQAANSSNPIANWISGIGKGWASTAWNSFLNAGTSNGYNKNLTLAEDLQARGLFNDRDKNMAFAILMDYGDGLDALNKTLGSSYNREDLMKYYWAQLLSNKQDDLYANFRYWIEQKGAGGYTKNGKAILNSADVVSWVGKTYLQDVDNDTLLNFEKNEYSKGYHKAGLDWVPRDNYGALLHKGEMVLNEQDANRYRAFLENAKLGIGGEDDWTSIVHSPWTRITSMWGNRPNPFGGGNIENHGGVDIAAPAYTPIGSGVSGRVMVAGWSNGGFGNHVKIVGDNGFNYIFGHMVQKPSVNAGDQVKPGQLIGYVGSTGRSTGNHLHFQVGKGGWTKAVSVDPIPHLNTGVLYPNSGNITGVSGYEGNNTNISNSSSGTSGKSFEDLRLQGIATSRRIIPGMGGANDNLLSSLRTERTALSDSDNKVINTLEKIPDKIIKYLEEVREEQDAQRKILNAFAQSQMRS